MSAATALITGLSGLTISPDERAFLKTSRPCGIILFTRNCDSHDQIRALCTEARSAIGHDDVLVLIDQEGGRVQRLRPPLARALPPASAYARLYDRNPSEAIDAAFHAARLVAAELRALSINMNCAPVLDLPVPGSHDIIGDRAYGLSVDQIVMLARAVAGGLSSGGVVPVIKHIPGHGRAMADSHYDLPVVVASHAELTATDFATFRALRDAPAAMTAHVVYAAIDQANPATTSPRMIGDIIRREIGFDGFLMSDDVSMQALSGTIRARAESSIAAGCDCALHCNGDLAEMEAAASGVPKLAGPALARFERAFAITHRNEPFREDEALAGLALALSLA